MINNIYKIHFVPIYLWRITTLLPILLVLLICTSYLIYYYFTIDQVKRFKFLLSQELGLKSELKLKYAQKKSLAAYTAKTVELDQVKNQVNERFPQTQKLPAVLIQISQLAEDANMVIDSFNVQQKGVVLNDRIMVDTYQLRITADYLGFVDFIYQAAKLSRLVEMVNLHLTRIDDHKINASFDLKIFYSRE